MYDTHNWRFPFGQPVKKVVQTDRTPKTVFVLGVYASAVHAKWLGKNGKNIVQALAVASEPYIFWKGDYVEDIIKQIAIPPSLGKLIPADPKFNGPSGIALDELILKPLGLERGNAWLCDLVPYSCVNPSQKKAIERAYSPINKEFKLPEHTVPPVPFKLADNKRRKEISDEFLESKAKTLILLGDQPIKWFLHHYNNQWNKLSDFGYEKHYGKLWPTKIDGMETSVLPLAHPRQIAKLGRSSAKWYNLHQEWLNKDAHKVLNS